MKKMLVVLAALCVYGARAEERTVSTAADLVAALEALNSKTAPAEPNVIYLEPGSYDVSAYSMPYWNGDGNTQLPAKHLALSRVTVSGKTDNPRDTVIYGNGTDGIAHCYYGELKHLTISNGCDTGSETVDRGGGVYSGTHSNVIVTCCYSKSIGGGVSGGTWYDCTIISNRSASSGGGVYSGILYNCNVISNYAGNHAGGCYYGTTLHNCRVTGNTAAATGGGISGTTNTKAYIDVYGGLIDGNYAGKHGGGAAYACFYGGTVVSNNVAKENGGGVYGVAGNFASNIMICCNAAQEGGGASGIAAVGCEIYANSAESGGGCGAGAYVDCVISNNAARVGGGGAHDGAYTNCLIACNMITGVVTVAKVYGGGLYSGTATRCVISNNVMDTFSETSGSQSYGAGASNAQVFDSIVIHNLNRSSMANVYGGGLYSGSASNTFIVGNAVYCTNGATRVGGGTATTDLRDCRVINNYINGENGCGVNGGYIYNCVVSNNCGSSAAGYCVRQVSRLENCEVVGRVNVYNGPAVNCRFVNFTNGVNWAVGENVIKNGYIAGGTSSSSYLYNYGLWATNCLFANNRYPSSALFRGGIAGHPSRLVNCTIADNVYAKTYVTASTEGETEAINCIFAGNKTSKGADNNLMYDETANKIHLYNCLIGPGRQTKADPTHEENTVASANAGFVGGNGAGRYEPGFASPARGAGVVQDWMADATDVRGDAAFPRLRDGVVDIGCYQGWLDPNVLYVDPNAGDDSLAGLSAASAKRTIDSACESVSDNGFTIVLLPGVHPSPSGDYSRKGSAPAHRVLFKSLDGPEQTVIDGNDERCLTGCMDAFTTIEGCTLRRFACANVNWQTFWGIEFTNCVFSGDFCRASSDCRRLFLHCVFRDCRGDINLTYGTDYDDSSGYYGNGTECFYGCVVFDSVFRITSSGNPHRFDGCSYFENCFLQLGGVTRLSDSVGAPHYNVLGNRQRFVDTTLVVGSATEWTSGGFVNCLLGLGNADPLPAPANVNSCILTNANAVLANLGGDLRPTEPSWRAYGYNRDQTDTDIALRTSLLSASDPGLANVSGRTTYAAYSEWATSVKTADGRKRAGVAAVAAAPNAWMSFALDSPTLLDEGISEDDLRIESFETSQSGDGTALMVLGVKDAAIGDDAMLANLTKLFQVEGASTLSDEAFSTGNVSVEFDEPRNGGIAVQATPKTASSSFFFRLKKNR